MARLNLTALRAWAAKMTVKTKLLIVGVALLAAFAAGRYTVPEKVKIVTQTVEVEKKQENSDLKEHTKTTIVKKPDGSSVTTIETVADDKTNETDSSTIDTQTSKEITRESQVTISALAGVNISSPAMVYGASVTKPILGPITIGLWGLSNATIGVSVGLSF